MKRITLKTINKFSLQKIFDFVKDHLLIQDEQAYRDYDKKTDTVGGCQYRTPDGLTCAVGIMIPKSIYNKKIEGLDVDGLFRYYGIEVDIEKRRFLRKLQIVHDDNHPIEWEAELKDLANEYNLVY